jgi:MFS-type transporter involved in bile tolerance (Atg22 family)
VQDKWSLSSVEMSVLLLMMVLLAGVGSLAAEMVAKRRDSAEVLRAGLLLIACACR